MNNQNDRRTIGNSDKGKQPIISDETGMTPPAGNADFFAGDQPHDDATPAVQGSNAADGDAGPAGIRDDEIATDAVPVVGDTPAAKEGAADIDDADGVEDSEIQEVEHVERVEDAEDHNCTEDFKPAPTVPGEFLLPIGEVGQWEHHFRRFSPLSASHGSALALSACYPLRLRPLLVLKLDDRYVVVDGRFLLEQIKAAHPGDPAIMVRVVAFSGTEEEAVEAMCNEGFGREPATKMETAHGLLALQRAGRKSQTALADQYAALTKDKVSQMLIAARLQDAYPVLFELTPEPHKLPISFGVALNKVVKAMPRSRFIELLARARALVDGGERCTPDELYDLLGLEQPVPKAAKPAPRATSEVEAAVAEAIFGEDDRPVGAAAPVVDGGEQFFLPAADIVERMTASEREAAANAFITRIVRYFGLERPG